MAKSTSNLILRGFSGKLGGIVLKNYNDVTIIANAPGKSKKIATQAQIAMRNKFKMASCLAVQTLKDPAKLSYYENRAKKKGLTAYNVAVADFLKSGQASDPPNKP